MKKVSHTIGRMVSFATTCLRIISGGVAASMRCQPGRAELDDFREGPLGTLSSMVAFILIYLVNVHRMICNQVEHKSELAIRNSNLGSANRNPRFALVRSTPVGQPDDPRNYIAYNP